MTSTLPPLIQAFSGAIGSASANAFVYPLDLVTTRLQLESPERSRKRSGIYGASLVFRHIFKKYGWEAFYDGLWSDTCATVLSNFFYFYFYSFLRSLSTRGRIPSASNKKGPHKPGLLEELVLGFIAGVASRVISTPLNIVTLRIQTEREDADEFADVPVGSSPTRPAPMGIIGVMKAIYKEQGMAGFWRGFQMSALLSLNPSITVAFFQLFRRALAALKTSSLHSIGTTGIRSLKNASANAALHPWEAFFGGAISNSVAVAILYPLILAKKRLQSSSSSSMRGVLRDAYNGRPKFSRNLSYQDKEKGTDLTGRNHTAGPSPGVAGLYQGLQMKIITGFLSQGVTFLVKGRIEQLIIAAYVARLRRT